MEVEDMFREVVGRAVNGVQVRVPCPDRQSAKRLRWRFYAFRKDLRKDPDRMREAIEADRVELRIERALHESVMLIFSAPGAVLERAMEEIHTSKGLLNGLS